MCLHFTSRSLCPVHWLPVENELLFQPVKKQSPSILNVPLRVSAGRLDQPGDPFLQGLEIQNTQTPAQWRALSWDGVSLFQLLLFTCFVCLQIIFLPPYYPLSAPVSNKCSKEPSPGSLGQQQKKMQPFQKMAPISSSVFFWSRQRTVQSPASSPFQK